jgi:hypothetical protein
MKHDYRESQIGSLTLQRKLFCPHVLINMEVIELIVLTYFRDFIEKIDNIVCASRARVRD